MIEKVVLTDEQRIYIEGLAGRVRDEANRFARKAARFPLPIIADIRSLKAGALEADAKRIEAREETTIVRHAIRDAVMSRRWQNRTTDPTARDAFRARGELARSVVAAFRR